MYTVSDFRKDLPSYEDVLSKRVDKWLKEEILYKYSTGTRYFEVPKWTSTNILVKVLRARGFTTYQHECGFIGVYLPEMPPPPVAPTPPKCRAIRNGTPLDERN